MTAKASTRFEALDSLRGICAIAVAFFHLSGGILGFDWFAVHNFWLFVDFFFVLSGFVIARSYGDKLAEGYSLRDFMWLRLGRVYPLYIAVLLALLVIEVARTLLGGSLGLQRGGFSDSHSWDTLFASTLALQSFGIWPSTDWNAPGWSLATEIWAYLIFALVCLFGRQRYTLVMTALALAMGAWLAGRGESLEQVGAMAMPRCLYGFGLGVLLNRFRPNIGGSGFEIVAVAIVVAFMFFAVGTWTIAATPAFAFVVIVFSHERGVVSRVLRLKPFLLLGELSYALYITHWLVLQNYAAPLNVVRRSFQRHVACIDGRPFCIRATGADVVLLPLVYFACVIVVAVAAHYLVERPGREWSRRWVKAGSARRSEAVAEHAAF